MNNIVLIGFMGSGKSSIGRALAKQKNMYFVDTDALIESFEGQKIRDMFEQKGEVYFRECEKNCFAWLSANVSNAVISTGGGMPTVIDDFSKLGKTMYLKVDFEILLERLKAEEFDKRPLFADVEFARKIFETRESLYTQKADLIMDANAKFEKVLKEVSSKA
ncbi:MAG: shikimate kinase [Campylobacterales bacterium]|nr:shikimate kinase [Campylobacterales bacterium]